MDLLVKLSAKYLLYLIILLGLIVVAINRKTLKRTIILTVISFPATLIVAKILSSLINNPRPFVVNHLTPLIPHATNNGFPSDHTLLAAAISSIIFSVNKKAGLFLFLLTLILGISRIIALVHHPIDILASLIIATTITFISLKFTKRLPA